MGILNRLGKAAGIEKKEQAPAEDPTLVAIDKSVGMGWNYVRKMIHQGAKEYQNDGNRTRIDKVCEPEMARRICQQLDALKARGISWDAPEQPTKRPELHVVDRKFHQSRGSETKQLRECVLREEFLDETILILPGGEERRQSEQRIQHVTLKIRDSSDYKLSRVQCISERSPMAIAG